MPGPSRTVTRRPTLGGRRPADASRQSLLVIDHRRLQSEAWSKFHTARKRLEKATRDLHRHETVDGPAYDSWLHRTFPVLVTTLRELHAEVSVKAAKIQAVQARAAYSGGSLKRLWREQKARDQAAEADDGASSDDFSDEGPSFRRRRYEAHPEDFERAPAPKPSLSAREVYRRLVQRLHPDRGGEWSKRREQLWHEVQQAWAAADADWLIRLEVEWESANEVLGPASPLSRLRLAIQELDAARRDIERKLRRYRASEPWRFTLREKQRPALHERTLNNLQNDIRYLQEQLAEFNQIIAAWEDDWTKPGASNRVRRRRYSY